MNYSLMTVEGRESATLFVNGSLFVADETHPNWAGIKAGLQDGDENVVDQFDVSVTVSKRFEKYSDRVSVANGHVYFDGDEVNNALTNQIIKFLEEGEDFRHLISFYENIAANPSEHSREQLFTWLQQGDFTITQDGHFLAYKGVRKDTDGTMTSISHGKAIVNGEVHSGAIPNAVGDVVEMPRSEVVFDPGTHCSVGLHAGNWSYASGFAQGAVLNVKINPRDVVSVPNDHHYAKLRTCRYEVLEIVEQKYDGALYPTPAPAAEDYTWGESEDFEDDDLDDDDDTGYDPYWNAQYDLHNN